MSSAPIVPEVADAPTHGKPTIHPNPNPANTATQQEKEADREKKLKLVEMFQAIKDGKLPTNQQIDHALVGMIRSPSLQQRKDDLSPDGAKLLQDYQDLLETLRNILKNKNHNDLFQHFVYHTHLATQSTKDISGPTTNVRQQDLTAEAKQAWNSLTTVARLLTTNSEFRSIIKELTLIARDVFGDVAYKIGDKVKPSTGEVASQGFGVSEPHRLENQQQNTTTTGYPTGATATGYPTTTQSAVPTGYQQQSVPAEYPQQSAPVGYPQQQQGYPPVPTQQTQYADPSLASTTHQPVPVAQPFQQQGIQQQGIQQQGIQQQGIQQQPSLQQHPGFQQPGFQQPGIQQQPLSQNVPGQQTQESGHVVDRAVDQASANLEAGINKLPEGQARDTARTGIDYIREKVPDDVQQQAKERAKAGVEYVRNKVPEEKQQELMDRVKNVVREIQMDDDYQDAIDSLFYLGGRWGSRIQSASTDVANTGKEVHQDSNVLQAEKELKTILEEFAQGHSLDPLNNSVQDLFQDIKNDPELSEYFQEIKEYLSKLLKEPSYLDSDESTTTGNQLIDRGRALITDKYRDHIDRFLNELNTFVDSLLNDPLSIQLGENIKSFVNDLAFDSEGNLTFKSHLLHDAKSTLLPSLLEQVQFIPIPRIEYSDRQYDITVDNIIISSEDFLPNLIELKMTNALRLSPFGNANDTNTHTIFFTAYNIQANVQAIEFSYKKKKGFPHMSDRGIADVYIGGRGLTVSVRISLQNDSDTDRTFGATKVYVILDKLKVKIRRSKHDFLYKILDPVLTSIVKKQITRNLENKIYDWIHSTDDYVTSVMRQAKKTASGAKGLVKDTQWNNMFGFLRRGSVTDRGSDDYSSESSSDYEHEYRRRFPQHRRVSEDTRRRAHGTPYHHYDSRPTGEVSYEHGPVKVGVPTNVDKTSGLPDSNNNPWSSAAFDPATRTQETRHLH